MTKEEIENKIATLTGGRAAEEVACGEITTGASNDIEQATKLARAMITRYGMSDEFDMVAMETVENQYLGGDTSLCCSADTQREIDHKVVELVRAQHEKAKKLLVDNKRLLDILAMHLYEKETITGDEFMEILNKEGEPLYEKTHRLWMAGTDRGYSSYNPWRFGDCIAGDSALDYDLLWCDGNRDRNYRYYLLCQVGTLHWVCTVRVSGCRGDQRDHRSGADGISAHRRTGCNIAASAMVYRTQRIEAVSSWIYPEFVQRKVFLCLTGHQCDRSGSRCADDILAADCFVLSRIFDRYIPDYIRSRQCSIGLQ